MHEVYPETAIRETRMAEVIGGLAGFYNHRGTESTEKKLSKEKFGSARSPRKRLELSS
jgi:hypothetical protein